jgi:hypothetical protein
MATCTHDPAGEIGHDFILTHNDTPTVWLTVGTVSLAIYLDDNGTLDVDAYRVGHEADQDAIASLTVTRTESLS